LVEEIKPRLLFLWNIVFTISVVGTILVHAIRFPLTPDSPPAIVSGLVWYQQIPLLLMLITFPVIYLDFAVFSGLIARRHPTPRKMAPGFLLGSVLMVILVFMNIFSNVWGYVAPISLFFRNKFWFSFLLDLVLITFFSIILYRRRESLPDTQNPKRWFKVGNTSGFIGCHLCRYANQCSSH
jgi:hypothetical protein